MPDGLLKSDWVRFATVILANSCYVKTIQLPPEAEAEGEKGYVTVAFPAHPSTLNTLQSAVLNESYLTPYEDADGEVRRAYTLADAKAQHYECVEKMRDAPDISNAFPKFDLLDLNQAQEYINKAVKEWGNMPVDLISTAAAGIELDVFQNEPMPDYV